MTKKKKKESWKEKRRRAAIKRRKALEAERLKREREPKKSKGWSKGKIFGVAFMFLLIIGIYGAWQYTQSPSSNSNLDVNRKRVPPFVLPDLDGNLVALENFTGKVVILNFFALEEECEEEIPYLLGIYEQYDQNEVAILSIDVHPHKDTSEELRNFRNRHEIPWKILVGTVNQTSQLLYEYDFEHIPTTFVVDRDGFIYGTHDELLNSYAYCGWDESYFSKMKNEINDFLGS